MCGAQSSVAAHKCHNCGRFRSGVTACMAVGLSSMLLCNLDAYRSRPGVVLARSRPKASFVLNGLDGGRHEKLVRCRSFPRLRAGLPHTLMSTCHSDFGVRGARQGGRAAGQPDVRPARAFAYSCRSASSHSLSFDHLRLVCFPFTAIAMAFFYPTMTTSRQPLVTAV